MGTCLQYSLSRSVEDASGARGQACSHGVQGGAVPLLSSSLPFPNLGERGASGRDWAPNLSINWGKEGCWPGSHTY